MSKSTILAPLKIFNTGSSLVESVESYLCRLADAYSVTPRQLIAFTLYAASHEEIFGKNPDLELDHEVKKAFRATASMIYSDACGYSSTSHLLITQLSFLTGQDNLRCGSLLPFRNILARNGGSCFVDYRRWCPLCYQNPDFRFTEPLAWGLKYVSRCELHGCLLVDRCKHCSALQRPFRAIKWRLICYTCGCHLGYDDVCHDELTTWDSWCESKMLELISHLADPNIAPIDPDFFNIFGVSFKEMYKNKLSRPHFVHSYLHRHGKLKKDSRGNRPRLDTLFKISAHQSVSPLDLILRPVECASEALFKDSSHVIPYIPAVRLDSSTYDSLYLYAQKLIDSGEHLPSRRTICRDAGILTKEFRRQNRRLYDAYELARATREESFNESKLQDAHAKLTAIIGQYLEDDLDVGVLTIANELRKATSIPKHLARRITRERLTLLGLITA